MTLPGNVRRAPIVAALLIGAIVAILNQTLISVALPKMMSDLNIDANIAQWLSTGFMLVNGVLIPVTAFLIARFSTRKLFISAMTIFSIGTLLCAIAPSFSILLIGRLIQAAGAGIMMPLMMVVILNIYPIERRGRAMGTLGIAMGFAPAIGPTLSGYIVQHYDWRVLFWIILPISVISIVIGFIFLKNVTEQSKPKLDIPGIILSTLGFGGLLYGFSDAGTSGWGSIPVLSTLIVGTIALILFIVRQLKADEPMLEFRIFKYDVYSLTTIINVIVTMALYAGMILLPIYLQNIRGFTPLQSGMLMLPGAILMGLMSPVTGAIFDRIGARWLSVIGLLIMVITTWEFTRLTETTTYMTLLINYTVRMFGMSLLMMPIQTAGLNQLPQRLNAHGTAMSNTLRMISGSIGTAILVTVMSTQSSNRLTSIVTSEGLSVTDKAGMLAAGNQATIYGINSAFIIATALSVAALILAFFIKNTNAQNAHPRQQLVNSKKGQSVASSS
ncbi:DHA2 family efflux MFS transporter permease subunit [Paenibacillus polymyxa]|uniref:DHA2 family efflux MFS transporter permease subunit n=1 Tax=Paenibacillus polymyxa TaxID=1406 RepID=A0A1D7MCU4_PAEPO|nr:DHA2 family efflux MFS transporter permease subunit [Paenibacillus polymyxa]MCF2720170.1 DHA2 family efflux MFS transporter permease subunit [Paenibacillus sp. UKAQ_18]AOK88604.1 MFS transporter [Paenibacillus polymyxa]KYG93197.1 MFS transporter [Paenibacillus polymyxa]MDY8046474.1 DHA2 family efflux MFS transporter permease subunit [Paenibacillus polymyxa]URJ42332.1 DHA2 family efflux MFS transporter permease subunit [Paenibacillus polymyxa]